MTTRLAFLILLFAMATAHTVYGDDAGKLPFGFIEPKNGKKERLWISFTKRYEADAAKYLFSIEPGCVAIDVEAHQTAKGEIQIRILEGGKFDHFHAWAKKRLGITGSLFKVIYREVKPIVFKEGKHAFKVDAQLHVLVEIKEVNQKEESEQTP